MELRRQRVSNPPGGFRIASYGFSTRGIRSYVKNVEFKVLCPAGFSDIKARLSGASCARRGILHQTDTYFPAADGWRLKLREIVQSDRRHVELISYFRPDTTSSRQSEYYIVPVSDAVAFTRALASALGGIRATVSKERELWVYEHTRIHLDTIDALGQFVEIETMMDGLTEKEANAEHIAVRALLALDAYPPVAFSYGDVAEFRGSFHANQPSDSV